MTIKEEQSKKAMEEFYNFIFAENVRDVETSKEFLEKIKQLEEALKILSEKTSEFTNVNKEEILAVIEDDNLEKIILFFRVLTAVSRMNMETYFVSDLCASGVFEPKIKEKDGEAVEREIKFGEKTTNMPKYDNLISMAKEHNVILKAMLDFFEKYELISKLQSLNGKKIEDIIELSKTLLKYSEKGAGAEKSGEEAEKIIKNKLKIWGLSENIDYNKNDEKLTDILKRKIEFLKNKSKLKDNEVQNSLKKIKSQKKSRQFDLVFPAEGSKKEPKVIAQIVFYTSNTGSEGKKKTNQNIDTTNYIKKILPKHSKEIVNLLVLDGPGWIQMAGEFQKNEYLSENFIQIRTVDTKLKKILNEQEFVYPIDVEIAIMELLLKETNASKKKVLEIIAKKVHIKTDKKSIIEQNPQFFEGKTDEDEIKIDESRHEIAKKFLILEKLQEIKPSKKSQEFTVLVPTSTNLEISDLDIFSEITKLGINKDEILKILKELKKEGIIIIR